MKKYFLLYLFAVLLFNVNGQQNQRTVFDDVDYVVEPIKSINTIGSDISPFFAGDVLYFSSIREKYFNKDRRERKNMAFYDLYTANLDPDGILVSDRNLVPGFGHDYHEGPADFCEATGELFITLSNTINPDTIRKMFSVEDIRLRLAIMKLIDGEWKITEEMPFNDDRFHFAHPAISNSGDTLIFSSDVDSLTLGQSDLFMTIRKNGVWSQPVNLGPEINTGGNEMFPTFIEGNLLSFASNGRRDGLGGLDLYYTTFPEMSEIKNLGNKINTHLDEFGLVIHPNQKVGYFASNRGNIGSDDIFRLDIKKLYFVFNGIVRDDDTNLPIANSKVDLLDCDKKIEQTVFTDEAGKFSLEVIGSNCPLVQAQKEGYIDDRKDISGLTYVELRLKQIVKREILVLDVETKDPISGVSIACAEKLEWLTNGSGLVKLDPPFPYDCELKLKSDGYLDQTLIIDPAAVVNGFARDTVWMYKKVLNKTFVLDNIYYDFDKWDILPESEIELNKLLKIMNDNPDLKVELGSHTDSRGRDQYNEWLSQKRSDSAVDYIIGHGISSERIVAKGYGEYQLVNQCSNGVKCSEEEHRKNRRTEFKIISFN